MTSVFQLFPYDILRHIMLYAYVYTLQLPSEEPELNLQVSLPPISASQVCRAWRHSLLSDPTMWRCIVIHKMSNDWIMELLRRSDTALLNVFLDFDLDKGVGITASYDDETHKMLSSLFQQTHRFRILRMRMDYWGARFLTSRTLNMREVLAKQILSYLRQPAPKLEILSLWLELDYYSNPEVPNIGTLFSGNAPNLKQIHYRPAPTFKEFDFPVLHNLSEIHLSLSFEMEFDRFLDLLELSPSLKVLCVCVDWMSDVITPASSRDCNREVSLPRLESLVLNVDRMVDLVNSFFQATILPPTLEWHINSMDIPDFEESPSFLEFLSGAHLTSLHVAVPAKSIQLFSEKHPVENYHNGFGTNKFSYIHDDADTLSDIWEPLEHAIELTRITHMVLESVSDCSAIFHIFRSTPNLKYLVLGQIGHCWASTSNTDAVCIRFLAMLIPLIKEVLEYVPHLRWDPRLDAPCSEDTHNSIPLPHCPLLRKVTLELQNPLGAKSARIVRECSGLRQKAGCPLQIHVCCPSIDKEAGRLLKEDDAIEVSIIPIKIKEGSWTQCFYDSDD